MSSFALESYLRVFTVLSSQMCRKLSDIKVHFNDQLLQQTDSSYGCVVKVTLCVKLCYVLSATNLNSLN